jgi:DNA-binding Xre family transcriptional regulator|nr:MAG TPA: LAMBDA REPRESSOR (TRIPLE MUTANT)/DNA COMPLEX-DNA COMPLEX, DOUBLE HELIX, TRANSCRIPTION-DNA.1A [Caudoviricetes sp.]
MRINYQKFFIACATAKMTMSAAVEKANISCFILSRIKHGKNVNAATAGKLAAALGVPVEELLDLER